MTQGGLGHPGQPVRRDRRYAWRRCSYMREQGQHVLSVVNVPESSMARA